MQKTPDFYDFCGVRLFVADLHIEITESGKEYIPSPIHRSFLLALLRKYPEVVTYEELWRDAWRSPLEMSDTDQRNIQTTKGQLALWFKDKIRGNLPIEAVPGTGYRLNCEVAPGWHKTEQEPEVTDENNDKVEIVPVEDERATAAGVHPHSCNVSEGDEERDEEIQSGKSFEQAVQHQTVEAKSISWRQMFHPNNKFVIATGFFYGFLYFIAAVLEIAYRFDVYGIKALFFGGAFLIINFSALAASYAAICRRVIRGKPAFLSAVSILAAAGVITILLSAFYLPLAPVTEANLQTQPAFVAFGKNVFIYFQPLAVVFLLMPFYAALAGELKEENPAAHIPSDVIFIKPWQLLVIYFGAVIFSLLTTNHLLDNLESENGYHALFSGLIFLRFVVYFGLGLGAIIWYHVQLNRNTK